MEKPNRIATIGQLRAALEGIPDDTHADRRTTAEPDRKAPRYLAADRAGDYQLAPGSGSSTGATATAT